KVHLPLRQLVLGLTRAPSEQIRKTLIGHRETSAIVEVVHVEAEASIRLQVDEMVQDRLHERGLPVRREPHDLVFAGVDLESGVIGERRIEQADRMGKMDLLVYLEIAATTLCERGRRPFPHSVHRQNN